MPRIGGKAGPRGTGFQVAQAFSTSSAEGFKDFSALFAIDEVLQQRGCHVPIMISGTITDRSGRTLVWVSWNGATKVAA